MIDRPKYMQSIEPFIGTNVMKILIGVRRSGKSTLLQQVRNHIVASGVNDQDTLHINLESAAFDTIRSASDLYGYIMAKIGDTAKSYVFLDEIQEVPGWEKALRSLMVDRNIDMYLTGSNSQLLSSELATHITGRYVEIPIYPFSFTEFIAAHKALGLDTDPHDLFMQYLKQGGFPFQYELAFQEAPSLQYLDDVFNSVLLKDVVQRNSIRDANQLERIVDYAIEQTGHTLSAKNISSYMKNDRQSISIDTIYSYLRSSEAACLLYRAKREDALGKRVLKFNEKFFLVDQGLRTARGFSNESAIDQVLENIVFMELKRRGYEVTVGKIGDKEIDFVARKGSAISYYQVCYLLASEETVEREFSALEAIPDNHPKTILSLGEIQRERNGIASMNLIDWLLL